MGACLVQSGGTVTIPWHGLKQSLAVPVAADTATTKRPAGVSVPTVVTFNNTANCQAL